MAARSTQHPRIRRVLAHLSEPRLAPAPGAAAASCASSASCAAAAAASGCYDVVVVGGSTAGASTAFHLANAGARVLVLEAGVAGYGSVERSRRTPNPDLENKEDKSFYMPGVAGTACPHAPYTAHSDGMTVKMMLGSPLPGKADDFVKMHGKENVLKAYRLCELGLALQKKLAKQHLPSPDTQIRQHGTVTLATAEEFADMKAEYDSLRALGIPVQLWDKKQVTELYGAGGGFVAGICYPDDAIINSSAYAAALLRAAVATGRCEVRTGTRVVALHDLAAASAASTGYATAVSAAARSAATATHPCVSVTERGDCVASRHVVVCAGGMLMNTPALDRLPLSPYIKPCWSYIVAMEGQTGAGAPAHRDSPNLLTYAQTEDWAICNGVLRLSGQDCNSARLQPHTQVRLGALATWARKQFAEGFSLGGFTVKSDQPFTGMYGVYTETYDGLPFLGPWRAGDRINYLMGCNARGQTSLSWGASVVPGLLGYASLTPEEVSLAAFLAPSRPTAKAYYDAAQGPDSSTGPAGALTCGVRDA